MIESIEWFDWIDARAKWTSLNLSFEGIKMKIWFDFSNEKWINKKLLLNGPFISGPKFEPKFSSFIKFVGLKSASSQVSLESASKLSSDFGWRFLAPFFQFHVKLTVNCDSTTFNSVYKWKPVFYSFQEKDFVIYLFL